MGAADTADGIYFYGRNPVKRLIFMRLGVGGAMIP